MLKPILTIIANLLTMWNSPARAKSKRQKTRAEIEREVREGKVDAMNERLKKNGIIKALFLPLCLSLTLAGCGSPKVVYINAPEKVDKITIENITYVLVPEGTYIEMVHRIEICTCQ